MAGKAINEYNTFSGNASAVNVLVQEKSQTDPNTYEHKKAPLDTLVNTMKGIPSGLASLDGSGKLTPSQIPDNLYDVLVYPSYASLPATGETGKIYITSDVNGTYYWNGTSYQILNQSFVRYRGSLSSLPSDPQPGDWFIAASSFSSYTSGHIYLYNGSSWDDVTAVFGQFVLKTDIAQSLGQQSDKVPSSKCVDDAISAVGGGLGNSIGMMGWNQHSKIPVNENWRAYSDTYSSISYKGSEYLTHSISAGHYASPYNYGALIEDVVVGAKNSGHRFFVSIDICPSNFDSTFRVEVGGEPIEDTGLLPQNVYSKISVIGNWGQYNDQFLIYPYSAVEGTSPAVNIYYKNLQIIDLTQVFGAGNEPTSVADFRKMYPADYYPYTEGYVNITVDTTVVTSGNIVCQKYGKIVVVTFGAVNFASQGYSQTIATGLPKNGTGLYSSAFLFGDGLGSMMAQVFLSPGDSTLRAHVQAGSNAMGVLVYTTE